MMKFKNVSSGKPSEAKVTPSTNQDLSSNRGETPSELKFQKQRSYLQMEPSLLRQSASPTNLRLIPNAAPIEAPPVGQHSMYKKVCQAFQMRYQ